MNREGQGAGHKIAERGIQGSGKNDREKKGGGQGAGQRAGGKKILLGSRTGE